MKDRDFLFNFICSLFILMTISCDKSDLQKSLSNDDSKLTTRTDDCEDCPVNDCCCSIEYVSGNGVQIEVCGTTGPEIGTSTCGPIDIGSCITISGYYWGPFYVDFSNNKYLFCMAENSSFMINALAGSTSVKITCQEGLLAPQTVTPTLTVFNRYYYTVNEDCELEACN